MADIFQQTKEAQKLVTDLEAKENLLGTQIARKLVELGYESEEEALQEGLQIEKEFPEYQEKLTLFLDKLQKAIEV